ncbi:hypothetical protein [Mitsuaria sp. 7]|uniref:hypothetical protein n=1 Tax=Mitsuaria sp. 7 TaxID=1658665 RepID=UPI0008349665|nr:hypothetical protein [Mitsuaria sp. 7]
MRRWLTVFLLILLPLQLSWAVAATYCAHEADPAVNHIGHHEHRHEASREASGAKAAAEASMSEKTPEKVTERAPEKAPEKATDKALTCVDDDCGFCHLGHSQPVASTPIVLPAVESLVTTGSAADVWSSRGPDRRERPNWLAA